MEMHDSDGCADGVPRRAGANVTRKREVREWDERHGKLVDLSAFQRDILPQIRAEVATRTS